MIGMQPRRHGGTSSKVLFLDLVLIKRRSVDIFHQAIHFLLDFGYLCLIFK